MVVRLADVTGDAAARATADELGIPPDAPLLRALIPGSGLGAVWAGFQLELLGIKFTVRPGEPNPLGPAFRVGAGDDGFDLVVQVWAYIVRRQDSAVYLESLWRPDRDQTYGIRGLEHPHRKGDVVHAWRALRMIKLVQRQGRRADKTREQVVGAIHHAARTISPRQRGRLTARALMAKMGIEKSVFYEDNARFEIDWAAEARRALAEPAT